MALKFNRRWRQIAKDIKPKEDPWRGFKPIQKGSYGGGLGHCDKCKNPRMTYVHCVKGLKTYCDKHKGGE